MPDSDDRLLIASLQEQNQALEARLEKYVNEIRFYRELGQAMTSTLDMRELLDLVANWSRKLINAEFVVVPLINNDKHEYYYAAASGEGAENIIGASFALDVGMCGWVLTHKETLVFAEGHEFLMEKKTVWEEGNQSALLVPLTGKKGIIGGLSGLGKRNAKCFSQEDIDALTLFANSVSPAIENAELFNEISHLVNVLEQQVAERTASLVKANQELERLARTDALTGLQNRNSANERLRQEFLRLMRSSNSYAVLFMDIDHFKEINDTYGHETGDQVLRQLAVILKTSLRETDFVARYGGEEFLAILSYISFDGALTIAEKIRSTVATQIFPLVKQVTVSIGMTMALCEDQNEEEAVHRADNALYQAKESGRNSVRSC